MNVLANVYFDWVAISRGITVLFFCVPIVLLCEYLVYRIMYRRQNILKTIIMVIYANAVSGIAGMFLVEVTLDIALRLSRGIFGLTNADWDVPILFLIFFFLTWFIEGGAIYILRRRFKVERILLPVGTANFVSYLVSFIILFIFMKNSSV